MLFQVLINSVITKKDDVTVEHSPASSIKFDKPEHAKFSGKLEGVLLKLAQNDKLIGIRSLKLYQKSGASKSKNSKDDKKDDSKDDKSDEVVSEDIDLDAIVEPKYFLTGKETVAELEKLAKEKKLDYSEDDYKNKKSDEDKIKFLRSKMTFTKMAVDLSKVTDEANTSNILEFILIKEDGKEFLAQTGKIEVLSDGSYKYDQATPFYRNPWFYIGIAIALLVVVIICVYACKRE